MACITSLLNRQYHLDSQGNALAITDGSQTVETDFVLDARGNVLSGSAAGNRLDYLGGLGYWRDPDLGVAMCGPAGWTSRPVVG